MHNQVFSLTYAGKLKVSHSAITVLDWGQLLAAV